MKTLILKTLSRSFTRAVALQIFHPRAFHWLLFVLSFFKRERPILVCEYANLVPRVIAALTGCRIHSHYFGYVFESEIQPALEAKESFV